MRLLLVFIVAVIAASCINGTSPKPNGLSEEVFKEVTLHYAKGFKIEKSSSKTRLTLFDSKDSSKVLNWFDLVKRSEIVVGNTHQIPVPCRRIICLSSTQLAYMFELDALDSIIGINTSRLLFNEKMKELIKSNKVRQVGKEGHFNVELIAALNPDVVFVSPFKIGGYDALSNLGFPLVPMAAYDEATPLGRAEWIKMMALFVGKEVLSDSIFNTIEDQYNGLKKLTETIVNRPTVFSGKMKSGIWYVPGGNSFFAHYFRDAGARYIIDDKDTGAYPMDFESLYQKAVHCDYWRLLVSENGDFNADKLRNEDVRYADFDAFKNKKVMICNLRQKPYYEVSPVKPQLILADYIHFFHPNILPNYKPTFYESLTYLNDN